MGGGSNAGGLSFSEARALFKEMREDAASERAETAPREAVTAAQLEALQSRLDTMHADQLLSDDELYALEDICADYIELKARSFTGVVTVDASLLSPAVGQLLALVGLSEGLLSDARFARQARRKFSYS